MISLEKLKILITWQKLPKNVEDLGKLIVAQALKSCPKSNQSPNLVILLSVEEGETWSIPLCKFWTAIARLLVPICFFFVFNFFRNFNFVREISNSVQTLEAFSDAYKRLISVGHVLEQLQL